MNKENLEYIEKITSLAQEAILNEVLISPKPGLVDRFNNGIHTDMNIYTFIRSATILPEYFRKCIEIGITHQNTVHELFLELRKAGKVAEKKMFEVTNGINTHKGAIFIFGLVLGAIGYLKQKKNHFNINDLTKEVSLIAHEAMQEDLDIIASKKAEEAETAGEKLFIECQIKGIRGAALNGFKTIPEKVIPFYLKMKENLDFKSLCQSAHNNNNLLNDIYVNLFLYILTITEDTNIIKKQGYPWFKNLQEKVSQLFTNDSYFSSSNEYIVNVMNGLEDFFGTHNISPGGSADMTALSIFYINLFESDF